MSQFEIASFWRTKHAREFYDPPLLKKGSHFIVKKCFDVICLNFAEVCQKFYFFSYFYLKLCWFIILDWDYPAGQKIL